MMRRYCTIFLLLILLDISCQLEVPSFAHLPAIPTTLPSPPQNASYNKHIPRKLWIAVKDRNDPLPPHLKELFDRNAHWEVNICDNACKDQFMHTVWANTSVGAIYDLVNPVVGAARADVWRYAVLYTYGGVYMDDDSDMKTPLDDVITPTDRLIMSEEGASSLGDCYLPSFHLSDSYTYHTYFQGHTAPAAGAAASSPFNAAHYNELKAQVPVFFHGHTLVNWGIFTAPRHPLFLQVLHNIVDIATSEYMRQSVVHISRWDPRWKAVMCTTGFTLTYTLRELELQNALGDRTALDDPFIPRICTNNFKQYGGNVKAFWTGGDSSHYMKNMQKNKHVHILHTYMPLNVTKVINFLHRKVVMGDTGRGVYLIYAGKKYTFNSYDKFLEMGYTDRGTRHVGDHILSQIPDGGDVATVERDVLAEQSGSKLPAPTTAATPVVPTVTSTTPQVDVSAVLTKAIQSINAQNTTTCFSDDYDGTRDDYLQDRHKTILGDTPVLVHPLCTNTFQLGNTLGYFLNDIACADIAGAHFIAVTKKFNIILPDTLYTYSNAANMLAFFHNLPDRITHPNPNAPDKAKKIMKDTCHCLQFCWENSEAPWIQRVPLIRRTLLPAVSAYLAVSNAQHLGTLLSNETDRLYIPEDMQKALMVSYAKNPTYKISPALAKVHLPLQPNVTIQYRCGDNIGFGKTKYGLLPFSVYKRIPRNAYTHIYIIADSPQRSSAHVYSYRCETILDHLVAYLVKRHPNTVIALKRGGDVFLDYGRLMNSNMVFCSASTFCLWPALGNDVGQVFFPLTPLIAKAATNETAPKFKDNFHWIGEVDMIKQFKHYRPWTQLIDELETL